MVLFAVEETRNIQVQVGGDMAPVLDRDMSIGGNVASVRHSYLARLGSEANMDLNDS